MLLPLPHCRRRGAVCCQQYCLYLFLLQARRPPRDIQHCCRKDKFRAGSRLQIDSHGKLIFTKGNSLPTVIIDRYPKAPDCVLLLGVQLTPRKKDAHASHDLATTASHHLPQFFRHGRFGGNTATHSGQEWCSRLVWRPTGRKILPPEGFRKVKSCQKAHIAWQSRCVCRHENTAPKRKPHPHRIS